MQCPNCKHENPINTNYCIECGYELKVNSQNKDNNHNEAQEIGRLNNPPVDLSPIDVKCMFIVTPTDGRPGILTIEREWISFKTKGILSALMGSISFKLYYKDICGIIRSDRYVFFMSKQGRQYSLSNNGMFSDHDYVDRIAYTVELYRRMYWYNRPNHFIPILYTYQNAKIDLNEITTERLISLV